MAGPATGCADGNQSFRNSLKGYRRFPVFGEEYRILSQGLLFMVRAAAIGQQAVHTGNQGQQEYKGDCFAGHQVKLRVGTEVQSSMSNVGRGVQDEASQIVTRPSSSIEIKEN